MTSQYTTLQHNVLQQDLSKHLRALHQLLPAQGGSFAYLCGDFRYVSIGLVGFFETVRYTPEGLGGGGRVGEEEEKGVRRGVVRREGW